MAVSAIFWTTVNAFDTPSDERVLQAPNNWSQPGPTSVRPGWLHQRVLLSAPECLQPDFREYMRRRRAAAFKTPAEVE
jgi:hypothetical protein